MNENLIENEDEKKNFKLKNNEIIEEVKFNFKAGDLGDNKSPKRLISETETCISMNSKNNESLNYDIVKEVASASICDSMRLRTNPTQQNQDMLPAGTVEIVSVTAKANEIKTAGIASKKVLSQYTILETAETKALNVKNNSIDGNYVFSSNANVTEASQINVLTPLIAAAATDTKNITQAIAVLSSANAYLPHVASESAIKMPMHTQQQHKIKNYHDAKNGTVWRSESTAVTNQNSIYADASTSNSEDDNEACDGATSDASNKSYNGTSNALNSVLKTSGAGMSGSPSLFRKSSLCTMLMPRRVSFPENDKELVTGYLEPANPWEQASLVKSISEIVELYVSSCQKHNSKPLQIILDHLKAVDLNSHSREPLLSLKSIKLAPNDCEPLEEIFKRIQYKCLDFSDCSLDESAVSALCQMIEYYEAANELDMSSNKDGMTHRGWISCTYMVGRSQSLHVLNAEGNPISKLSAESLGSALNTSNVHTIKLEHCGLKGAPFTSFCCKIYHNKNLKELWLGYNDLDCTDAAHLADLLRFNNYIELIDISNNNIRDEGMMYLVQALLMQSGELERRSMLQRAVAIEDENMSPIDGSVSDEFNLGSRNARSFICDSIDEQTSPTESTTEVYAASGDGIESVKNTYNSSECNDLFSLKNSLLEFENDTSDNAEDTVRSSTTVKSSNQYATSGQSMLDKLLSMNSDNSSNNSNDLLNETSTACSLDVNVVKDEIVQSTAIAKAVEDSPQLAELAKASEIESTPTLSLSTQQVQLPDGIEQVQNSLCDNNKLKEAKTTEVIKHNLINTDANSSATTILCPGTSASHVISYMHSNTSDEYHSKVKNENQSNLCDNGVLHSSIVIDDISLYKSKKVEVAEKNGITNGGGHIEYAMRISEHNSEHKVVEDYEDSHSTDSAFESSSECETSRHLSEDFGRLSTSLERSCLFDVTKAVAIETAIIATESSECLIAEEAITPSSTPTPEKNSVVLAMEKGKENVDPIAVKSVNTDSALVKYENNILVEMSSNILNDSLSKDTIATDSLTATKNEANNESVYHSRTQTPPSLISTMESASSGVYAPASLCFLNQSARIHSQSSDSLCSENSLDGSTSADPNLTEKLTKNDTLSRRTLINTSADSINKSQSGLKALTVWSNNLTKESGKCIAELLQKTVSLELLNIGKNCLSNEFIATIKEPLIKNNTLTTLGLQSAHLSEKGIEMLASILTFGGNSRLQRIDIRDNKLEVKSLNIIAELLKSNKTITQIDINDEPKRLTIGSDAHLDYARVLENVRSMCSRNEKIQTQLQAEKSAAMEGDSTNNRCRGGYYLGSRKISLTCHSRPLIDIITGTVSSAAAVSTTPTAVAKLEVKRKTSVRLRSPGPSPPTISPSSSPNRSRFQVSRVHEVSPLTSPLAQILPPHPSSTSISTKSVSTLASSSSCVFIPMASGSSTCSLDYQRYSTSPSLATSNSLPAMDTLTSSTQTVKRLSVSPRSRFHVCRIYEDQQVPIGNRIMPPITPPLNPPPTPMLKSTRKAKQLTKASVKDDEVLKTTVVIVEPTTTPSTTTININCMPVDKTANESMDAKLLPQRGESNGVSAALLTSTSSLSSSTSPVSLTSNSTSPPSFSLSSSLSASVSASASISPITASKYSQSSLPSLASTNDVENTKNSSNLTKHCPIAVFSNNDITPIKEFDVGTVLKPLLNQSPTENANVEAAFQQQQHDQSQHEQQQLLREQQQLEPHQLEQQQLEANQNQHDQLQQQQQPPHQEQQQRLSKKSWIANPTAVDKLLTLFNAGTIFQRSSSPESVSGNQCTNIQGTSTTSCESRVNVSPIRELEINQPSAPVSQRKLTPASSWTKIGAEFFKDASHTVMNMANENSGTLTTPAMMAATTNVGTTKSITLSTIEQSRSFLDSASRQFRDFSKQVFCQNLTLDNLNATSDSSIDSDATSGSGIRNSNNNSDSSSSSSSSSSNNSSSSCASIVESVENNEAHISTNLKLELQRDITPEHIKNEETLQKIQNLADGKEFEEDTTEFLETNEELHRLPKTKCDEDHFDEDAVHINLDRDESSNATQIHTTKAA